MKKVLALLLAFVMVFSVLAACGPSETDPTSPPATQPQTEKPDETEAPEPTDAPTESAWQSKDPNYGTIIIGSSTEISGDWGRALWTNNATDAMIRELTDAYSTVVANKEAEYVANETVVKSIESEELEGGTKVFTIEIHDDLTYNNGDPITAKDFVAASLFGCTQELVDMKGKSSAYLSLVGGQEYLSGEADFVSGIRLLDDYTFSFEILEDKLPYYYDLTYAGAYPMHYKNWFGEDVDILDDGEGAYFNDAFTFENVEAKVEAERFNSDNRVSAGPYTLIEYDDSAKQAILEINPLFKGDLYGDTPSVERIVIIKAEEATWADALKTGVFNVYDKVTGGDDINNAMDIIEESGALQFVSYERAGYGKLMFQCDFGPTQFIEVRHAVAHLLDRPEFAETFTSGWGGLVHGPYGVAQWMYKESEEWIEDNLEKYPFSLDLAVDSLESGGWVLDENGDDYAGSGLRYKEVTAEEAGDFEYVVELADGRTLMALEFEWFSTEGNEVSDLLAVMLAGNPLTAEAGMKINKTEGTFEELLNYMYRDSSVGDQYGVPTYGMYNLASNFTPAYDYAYNWTTDPEMVAGGWNVNYLFDEELDQLSMDMVYGVEAGDDEAFLDVWQKYIQRWNELLPEVPLYSNMYITVIPDWLENFEMNPFWSFQSAIVGATVRPQG